MLRSEWDALFDSLVSTRDDVLAWDPAPPEPNALRCEHSRHRTLAHLRACQEQWMQIVAEFLDRKDPSVKILHPWRKFDQEGYATRPWEEHMAKFLDDRERWLTWQAGADWARGGKWNSKPDTVGGLTKRLAHHELYHIGLLS